MEKVRCARLQLQFSKLPVYARSLRAVNGSRNRLIIADNRTKIQYENVQGNGSDMRVLPAFCYFVGSTLGGRETATSRPASR